MQYALGAASAFDALIYPEKHPGTIDYLRNQFTHYSDTLNQAGKQFLQRGAAIVETFNNSEALRFARSVVQNTFGNTQIENNIILSIFELEKFQSASLNMQRWIMANPTVRNLYHNQKCDGFSATYIDVENKKVAENHYDWRRVNNGIMHIEKDNWTVTQYFEDLKEGDRDLLIEEQTAILRTWNSLDFLLALGEGDPTSAEGAML